MTDKEKILAEIQKRIEFQKTCIKNDYRLNGRAEEEIIFEYQKLINFINSLSNEPISEKKCMYSKDNYTDEDRKVLCEDCKKKCEYSKQEELVSNGLEEEIGEYLSTYWSNEKELHPFLGHIAKHFFELGLKAKNWKKERMEECPYRQVVCTMYEDKILECNGACSWVMDYPKLKELKAQKGE